MIRTNMRMLKWILGLSLKFIKENDKKMPGGNEIEEKIKEARLKWFGHMKLREEQAIRKVLEMPVTIKRRQRRPVKCWKDGITNMNEKGITEHLVVNKDD